MFHDGDRTAETRLADDGTAEVDEPPQRASATSRRVGTAAPASASTPAPPVAGLPANDVVDRAVPSPIEVLTDAGVVVPGGPRAIDSIAVGLAAVVAELGVAVARLSIRLVDDGSMRALHARHCGLDTTTDVLTFPSADPGEPVDADVACCVDEAARQAARRGHPVAEELLLYAVHGLLHCLGHDDRDPEGFAAMHAEEDRVLAAIGASARFATSDREDPPVDATVGRSGAGSAGVDR